jgi:hypothetical protein
MNVMTAIRFPADTEADIPPQRPTPVLLTNEAAFCDWVARSAPGASTVYFRGHLAYERMPSVSTFAEPERKRLVALAKRALQAAEDGLVHLVQRRHGPEDYGYIAVKVHVRRAGRLIPAAATAGR